MRTFFTLLLFSLSIQIFAQDSIATHKTVILDIHAGTGLRLGETENTDDSFSNDYAEKLRSGFAFDVSMYFVLKPESNHFIGFKYNAFRKKVGIENVSIYYQDGSAATGKLEDDVRLTMYGASYMYAKHGTSSSQWSLEATLGYMTYRDKAILANKNYDIKGGTIGALLGAGYYFRIANGVYLGPKINLLIGAVKKLKIDGPGVHQELTLDNSESLTRLDITAGFRFEL